MKRIHWSPEVVALGDRLVALSAAGAAELSEFLDVVHGVRAPELAAISVVEPDHIVPEPKLPTEFDVFLEDFDPVMKISVIRVLREITGLGLREALVLTGTLPQRVKERLPQADAELVRSRLESTGARVSIRGSAA